MRYPKELVLKNCTEVVIRPLTEQDEQALREFYSQVSEEDRWFMRFNVMDPAVIRGWVQGKDEVFSIVAECGGQIAAHARLHTHTYGCYHHQGRLRIIVLPEFRQKRLGSWMLLDLIHLSMEKGLRELRADFVVGIEDAAIEAARKLDFFKVAVLPEYVKSPRGTRYDLQVMIKRLHRGWGDF